MKTTIVLTAVTLLLASCGTDDDEKRQAAARTAPVAAAEASAPVAGTAARARAASQPAAGATHTVVRGDTLGAIARRYGVTAADLAAWNDVRDPRRLQVGQELRLSPP